MPPLSIKMTLAALLLAPTALAAQERQTVRDFTLSERVPEGRWIRVRNLNGDVRVRSAGGV